MTRSGVPARGEWWDRGAAAVELAITFTAILAFGVLAAPLGQVIITQVRLERAVGEAARFATEAPYQSVPGFAGAGPGGGYQPSAAQVSADAVSAFAAEGGGASTATVAPGALPTIPGQPVRVNLSSTVNLGPFAGLMSAVGLVPDSVTLTATAVASQE